MRGDRRGRHVGTERDLVAHAERPGQRGLHRGHVGDDDDVPLGGLVRERRAGVPDPPPRSTSDSPPAGAQDGSACQPRPHVARHVAQRRAVELAVVELDPAVVDLDGTTERLGRLAGAAERAADDPGGRQHGGERRGLAAAELVERRDRAGGRAAARRRSPRCGRGARRSARSRSSRARCRARRDRFGGTRRGASGSSRRNRRYSHQQVGRADQLEHDVERAPAELRQLGRRPVDARGPATRTPRCRPTRRRGRGGAASRSARRASGAGRAAGREPRTSRWRARARRRPGRGGAGARRSGPRPAGARCPARPAGSRRTGCGRPPTRSGSTGPTNQRTTAPAQLRVSGRGGGRTPRSAPAPRAGAS